MLNFNKEIKNFYPYRTAYVHASFILYLSKEQIEDIREYLGDKIDNHICWQDEDELYYMFTDGMLRIGNEISISNW